MNDLPVGIGEPLPDDTVIPDLSGNGLDAVVEANQGGSVGAMEGDPNFDGSTACGRTAGGGAATRIVVNNDNNAFEFAEDEDFSIELYVRRAEDVGGENWGILAGTWHSRTLLNDVGAPDQEGAWYGYGFIRHNEGGGWAWNCSPINPDGTFTPSFNELSQQPRFEIEAGSHYVVASVDRQENNLVSVYLDGSFVGSVGLPAGRAFIKPTGYEHARFMFLTGEDDSTRNAYRPAPRGYAIDAARVQGRTISADEVFENWDLIQTGKAVPDTAAAPIQAVVSASSRNVAVGQCVLLTGANSSPGPGATITKYEWKIGSADFVEGTATREVAFDAPTDPAGIQVTLRVTDNANGTATASLRIVVTHLRPAARIEARRGTDILGTSPIIRVGDILTLDASASSTPVPPSAFVCPIAENRLLPEPAITEYRWDVRNDGSVDDRRAVFDLPAATTSGKFPVRLTVVNASLAEDSRTIQIEVVQVPDVEPAPPGRIFLTTPETVAIWEMNDLPVATGEPLLDGTVIPDLSGSGLDAVVEANESGAVGAGEGDALFDDNTSCGKIAPNNLARIVVNDDADAFEMNEEQDFSIELYVRRAEEVGGENWGILAGTWHSRTLLDDAGAPDQEGAWYGYGFIRHNEGGGWRFTCSPINPDGTFNPSFNEVLTGNFEIPAGSHYVVATANRVAQSAKAYLDGGQVGSVNLPAGRPLITPTDYEHARFMFLTGEDDGTRNAYRPAPIGYFIDAARVMKKALSAQEIRDNYKLIKVGVAVPPAPRVGPRFIRGDCNDDRTVDISDAVCILDWLFLGGTTPGCVAATNADGAGAVVDITDPIHLLTFLFLGGPGPPKPSPACGTSDLASDQQVGCVTSPKSCQQ